MGWAPLFLWSRSLLAVISANSLTWVGYWTSSSPKGGNPKWRSSRQTGRWEQRQGWSKADLVRAERGCRGGRNGPGEKWDASKDREEQRTDLFKKLWQDLKAAKWGCVWRLSERECACASICEGCGRGNIFIKFCPNTYILKSQSWGKWEPEKYMDLKGAKWEHHWTLQDLAKPRAFWQDSPAVGQGVVLATTRVEGGTGSKDLGPAWRIINSSTDTTSEFHTASEPPGYREVPFTVSALQEDAVYLRKH